MSLVFIIVGPTASGKTARALALAEQVGGEIVSCDSMQIYRECDIVTAKATPEEQKRAPHHLIDVCAPTDTYSAARWAHDAARIIGAIQARGNVPIVCGGTGFYLRALLEPAKLSAPAPDESLRARLEERLKVEGAASLKRELADLEPQIAQKLAEGDDYRLVRALQIALQRARGDETLPPPHFEGEVRIEFIAPPRDELYARIEARVEAMLAAGALEELRSLRSKWGENAPALGGVGYRQLAPALDDPTRLDECVDEWKRATRRYAKRQMTWFRHQLPPNLETKVSPDALT